MKSQRRSRLKETNSFKINQKKRAEKVHPQVYQQVTTGKTYAQSVSNPVQPSTSQKAGSSIEEELLTIMSNLEKQEKILDSFSERLRKLENNKNTTVPNKTNGK
jgi:uncharacterized protein YcbX